MISVSGKTQLTFMLPVDIETAFNFYRDVKRILLYLPRIQLVQTQGNQRWRVCYVSRELSTYDVIIYCDVQAKVNPDDYTIHLAPQEANPPIKPKSGFNSTSAYGRYTSTSVFFPNGRQTRLEYQLELAAELPKPWALKLIPDGVMGAIASSIADHRIQEIANGFIEKSTAAIPAWQIGQTKGSSRP